jgi:hypothetical protein
VVGGVHFSSSNSTSGNTARGIRSFHTSGQQPLGEGREDPASTLGDACPHHCPLSCSQMCGSSEGPSRLLLSLNAGQMSLGTARTSS